jgi:AcrR family transcriptional regulator
VGELRATAPDEKAARRRRILTAAEELLDRWSFTDVSMERIGRRAGVAKSTLYLYFPTKEALFLGLYDRHLEAWYAELGKLVELGSHAVDAADAARVIASTLSSRRTLIQLHGLMHSSLVRNIDLETIGEFTRRHHHRMARLAPALANRIDGLSGDSALRLLVRIEVVAGGLAGAALRSPRFEATSEDPNLEVFRIDFEEELREIITALLKEARFKLRVESSEF